MRPAGRPTWAEVDLPALAQNLRAAEICRKYGIAIWANYMLGLPTETEDDDYYRRLLEEELRKGEETK